MAWFDQSRPDKLFPAHFDDVTPRQRRQPSWLVKGRRPSSPVRQATLPPPPLVPREARQVSPRIEGAVILRESSRPKAGTDQDRLIHLPNEASRPSMSPVELEALVAERAAKQTTEQWHEEAQTAVLEAIQRLANAHEQIKAELRDRSVNLAILIARRVVARELRTQPHIVTNLVREGLEVLNARDHVRVHLGPEFAVMKEALEARFSALGTMIEVVLDLTLPAYGCVIETEVGSVDESIESRISTLLEALNEAKEA